MNFEKQGWQQFISDDKEPQRILPLKLIDDGAFEVMLLPGQSASLLLGLPPEHFFRYFYKIDVYTTDRSRSYTIPEIIGQSHCTSGGGTMCEFAIE